MKYIKTFEFVDKQIELPIGYYVIPVLKGVNYDEQYKIKISNNIYRIINKSKSQYKIDFKDYYHEDGFWIDKKDVYKFSAVKKVLEDRLELIKQSNKFNV